MVRQKIRKIKKGASIRTITNKYIKNFNLLKAFTSFITEQHDGSDHLRRLRESSFGLTPTLTTFRLWHASSHYTKLYHTTVFRSILHDGRAWRDPDSLSWLPHWTDVAMISEGITESKKRALPKPINIAYSLRPYQILTHILRALPNSLIQAVQ